MKDWSSFNVKSFFKSTKVPLDYIKDRKTIEYTGELSYILDMFRVDRENNPTRLDITRRKRLKPGPKASRLAFPTKDGYTTYKEAKTGHFFTDLYNLCLEHGIDEPKLLVNHALMQPWWPEIYPNPEYKIDFSIPEEYITLWHSFLRELLNKTSLDDIKIYAHKTTSPGPPFNFKDGTFFQKEDVLFGSAKDFDNLAVLALRKDYSSVKRSFLPAMSEIFERQVEISEITLENYRGNVIKDYLDNILPVSVSGFRDNSIDPVVNVSGKAFFSKRYYTKSRYCTIFTPTGIIVGTIDIVALTDYLRDLFGFLWGGSAQRPRKINNENWVSQFGAAVGSKMITLPIEDSVNGFASNRPITLAGYDDFIRYATGKGNGDFLFVNGDRTNAETTVTTNYREFKKLILPEFLKLYDFQNTAITLEDILYSYTGLPSGVARTTEINWYAGTFEALYTLSLMLRIKLNVVAAAYFNSVLSNESFFTVDDFVIKLFMCTDDIPLIIYGPVEKLDLAPLSTEKSEKRLMKWTYSKDGMSTFGMSFSKSAMRANETSIISKLFYCEHPGFYVRDCFSLCSKIPMLESSLAKDVMSLYNRYYNTTIHDLNAASKAFLGWLAEFNIPISEAVDVYSPAGKLMYGKYTSSDSVLESSRVETHFIKPIFDYYKKEVKK